MAENVYSQIGKKMGKDVRLVRAAAHHPFEFFSKIMADPKDHRPIRFRYLGAFYVKPYWRKGLRNINKVGPPEDGKVIWARIPENKFNKTYINLKKGIISNGMFISLEGESTCPVNDIKFWGPDS